MKHPSVASPESEEDDVSECTMSCFDYGTLRQVLMLSKESRKEETKAKIKELERLLLDEKQEGMGSKHETIVDSSESKEDKMKKVEGSRLRLLLVSIPLLLSCLLLFCFFPPSSTPQLLLQSEVQLADGMNKTFEKSQTWIGDLEKALKIAERKMSEFEQINHDQADNIKYASQPFSIEELVAKVKEATELQIESKLQVMAEMMIAEVTGKMNETFFKDNTNTCRIGELEKALQVIQPTMIAEKEKCVVLKNLQSNWTEKCSEQIIASEEMNATANESMSKKNMAHVLVQEEKEKAGEAAKKGKGEMVSHFELLMELVRNASQAQENCNGALNEMEQGTSMMMLGCIVLVIIVSVFVAHKVIGLLTKLAQTQLSLHEALHKISKLEKKKEGSKLFEGMTEKLLQELQAKEAGIQSAREIEEAMAEMKEEMKAQGEEMSRFCEEKDAALDLKVKGLKDKLEMQAKMLVQAQADKEKAQKENNKAIQEVTQKFLQAIEEKEAAIKSAKQRNVETTSKLAQTELTLQKALQKISNLEKEMEDNKCIVALGSSVWKSTGTKLVSHSGSSWLHDVLNCGPLKSGTFEWKIQVHTAYALRLGVIGSSLKFPLDHWIGNTNKTWGYQSHSGNALYWNDGQKEINNLPKYTTGSVVNFLLDLTNEGTLCISIDGSPSVQLFSNMKSPIDKDEGFLPATSMYINNNIELLEFKCH